MTESSPAKPIWYYPVTIFWNFTERRLRFLWRFVALIVLTGIISVLVGFLFLPLNISLPAWAGQLQLSILFVGAVWLVGHYIDRRKFSETGVFFNKNWWIDLGFGSLLGALLMAAIFLIELAAGWITISDTFVAPNAMPFFVAILIPFVFYIGVSILEELLFRGYLLLNLAEAINMKAISSRVAVIISLVLTSAVFGVAHAANPSATLISTLNITVAGIFLGLAYVLTGSLAIPLGIHLTWNFFQGNVFGFPVSGTNNFSTSVFAIEQGGPLAWTGGPFGPEAGIIGLLAMLAGTLSIVWWVRRRYGKVAVLTSIAEPPQSSI